MGKRRTLRGEGGGEDREGGDGSFLSCAAFEQFGKDLQSATCPFRLSCLFKSSLSIISLLRRRANARNVS